ncbi:MAG: hypothetical protein CVU13_04995 [Bacteroidetes bacterium HGW-Bacteroidetes-8]|jgi:hypothetical protein|nr:MAG: hypothetical protein CVU13_04995 [Bacteroidetes bacterium HGW-Bacteroidetes-8]
MELDEIKTNWQELSRRVEKSEIFNRKVIMNMLRRNADSSLGRIERYEYFFLIISALVSVLFAVLLSLNDQRIVKNESIVVCLSIMVIAAIWQGYKIWMLNKLNYETCTTLELIERGTRFRVATLMRLIVGMLLLIPSVGLIIYFQRDLFPPEMFAGVAFGGVLGLIIGLKAFFFHWKSINSLISDLKEMKSYEKE